MSFPETVCAEIIWLCKPIVAAAVRVAGLRRSCTQKKKLLNELKKIRVNFSTKFNYIFPPKSNLFEMSCCNLVV